MTAEIKQECSPLHHKFDIEYVCNQQGCKSHLLCNLCFQTHRQICPGIFGEAIKKLSQPQPGRSKEISNDESETPMDDTFEAISESPESVKNSSTTMTAEEFIGQYNTMKLKVEQPISKLFDREKEICQKNLASLEQVKQNLISLIEAMYKTWGDEQEGKLRGMSESSQQKLTRLKEIQTQVQGMHFDPSNLIKTHSNIQELETNIAPEAKNLVEAIRQVMDGWVLNQDRINDYQEAVSRFIQGIEFTSLLNKEKLEFKASSLPQAPDDEVQKIRKEVEILRIGDLYLKEEINKLRQEIESLKNDAKTALDALTKAKDEILAKEKDASKAALAALTKKKDDAIANITKQKTDADNAFLKEREDWKITLEALAKTKDNAIASVAKQKTDSDAALVKEKETNKAALDALTKAKDDLLAKEKEANKAALDVLTKIKDDAIANITKQKADADAALAKERDASKAALVDLTKKKDEAIANVTKQKTDADAALVKEKDASKAALTAINKTKDEAIAKLTKELNDLKAKIPK